MIAKNALAVLCCGRGRLAMAWEAGDVARRFKALP